MISIYLADFDPKRFRINVVSSPVRRYNFDEAESDCMKGGSHLLAIRSESEQRYMSDRMRAKLFWGKFYWLGFNGFRSIDGIYRWNDQLPLTYSNWKEGQGPQPGKCIGIDKEKDLDHMRWTPAPCSTKASYICKAPGKLLHTIFYRRHKVLLETCRCLAFFQILA